MTLIWLIQGVWHSLRIQVIINFSLFPWLSCFGVYVFSHYGVLQLNYCTETHIQLRETCFRDYFKRSSVAMELRVEIIAAWSTLRELIHKKKIAVSQVTRWTNSKAVWKIPRKPDLVEHRWFGGKSRGECLRSMLITFLIKLEYRTVGNIQGGAKVSL